MNFFKQSLKISQKLLLSVLAFSIPIVMLLYFTVSGINYDINFARLEIYGNRLLNPLTQLLTLIPQHQQLLEIDSSSNLSSSQKLDAIAKEIQQEFIVLDREIQSLGKILKITPSALQESGMAQLDPSALSSQWHTLQSSQNRFNLEQLIQRDRELTLNIRELISRIGDNSNLILDPDLDSYYLMDVVLLALPQAQNRVGEILLFGQDLTQQQKLSDRDRIELEVDASLLQQTDLDRISRSLATSLQEDKNFYGTSASLQGRIPSLRQNYEVAIAPFIKQLQQLARSPEGTIPSSNFFEQGDRAIQAGSELWEVASQELNKLLVRRIWHYRTMRFLYLASSLLALAITSFFVVSIARAIARRLNKAVAITQEVAKGNLTARVRVDSSDEIGQLLAAIRSMIQSLNLSIGQAQESGMQVSASSTELFATAKQQEVTVKHQVEAVEYILKSMAEISQLTEKLANAMAEVAAKSEETARFASMGQSALVRMEESMQTMEEASGSLSDKLQAIHEKTQKITTVVTTIIQVADRTNLLSLNAAIEAEKAGESGRGFAVVAKEIRRLADQTAVATLEIEKMVAAMQLAVSEGTIETNSFVASVRDSAIDVSKVGMQLSKIIEQVQALSPSFDTANAAMNDRLENIRQINQATIELSAGMQQMKSSLQETFTAIAYLNDAASRLRDRVSGFEVSS